MRRTPLSSLALVAAAMACDCGGEEVVAAFWMADPSAPRVVSLSALGEVGVAAEAPALDAPVRAFAARGDGAVVALQDTSGGAPPAVVLSRSGARLATFDAVDGTGATLFPPAARPWAAARGADGRIWVTGRASPALFHPDGRLSGFAVPVAGTTTGIAALPDGRMLVAFGANGAAAYAADGAAVEVLVPDFGTGGSYSAVDAIAARPDGTVVVAVLRHGASLEGVLVEVAVEPGRLAARGDPEASARLPALPSSIALVDGFVAAGPSLGPAAPPACVELVSADLAARHGCLVPGLLRGVIHLP